MIVLVLIAVFNLAGLLLLDSPGDMRTFVATGRAFAEGRDPYAIAARDQNLLAPLWLPVVRLLAVVDLDGIAGLWRAVSAVLYLAAIAVLARVRRFTPFRLAWLLAFAGLWETLIFAQVYVLVLWLILAAWLALDRHRSVLAGLAIGLLIALKPNFALWPVLLFVAGYPAVSLVALISGAVLFAVPGLWYGPGVLTAWLRAASGSTAPLFFFPANASLFGLTARLGLPWLAWPLVVAAVLFGARHLWRLRPSVGDAGALALAVTLLVSPLAWIGYALALMPALLLRPWSRALAPGLTLLVVPLPVVLLGYGAPIGVQLTVGSLYCYALILVLVGILTDEARPTAALGAVGKGARISNSSALNS